MNKRVLVLIIIALCFVSILVGTINTVIVANKKSDTDKVQGNSEFLGLSSGGNKIALISLDGEISSEVSDNYFGDKGSAESVRRSLRRAMKDRSVKGILLKINSPGGTVAASQEIYSMLLKIRKKKPVVVAMEDLAASGGYYVASAADRIFAQPGTLTGSIGVIMNSYDAHQLLEQKLGIKYNIIKSGRYKDIASPYRAMSSDDQRLLQNLVSSTYGQFVNAIKMGRVERNDNYKVYKTTLTLKNLKKYADGRVFTGEQALKLGFVDQMGGIMEAQDAVNKMAQSKFHLSGRELPLIQYNVPTGFGELFFSSVESAFSKKDAISSFIPLSARHPHLTLFLWE